MSDSHASVQPVAVVDATPPAPGAEDQKPNPPPEGEVPPETAVETTEQQEAKRQSKFQRRLDRQKTARIEAEVRAKIAEEKLAKLEAQAKPAQETGEPKQSDFEDYTAYTRALARWEAQQVATETLKTDREAQQGRERQERANAGTEKVAKAWSEREQTFQAATKDYVQVVDEFTGEGGDMSYLSQQARMAIIESDVGPALLYHVANLASTDPAAFERLANLSPTRQIAELGKLETKVSMPAKKTTSAPAPATTTTGGRTASKDLSKMSQEEYEAYRKSQGARWAR